MDKKIEKENKRLIRTMSRLKCCLSRDQFFLRSDEFVTLRRLQQMCKRNGLSIESFLSLCDSFGKILEEQGEDTGDEYLLEDVIAVYEMIREEKGFSKSEVRRCMKMDQGNFYRFTRRQKTTAMEKIEALCSAIDTPITEFFNRLKSYVEEKGKDDDEDDA